jgi:hypothetical protein
MIIWRGAGLLALPGLIVACVVFGMASQFGAGPRGSALEAGAVLVAVAGAQWWLGARLNAGRRWADARHSMYGIPVKYYALPLAAAGGLLAIQALSAMR